MKMDGIIGEIALTGLDERSYRLLKLGEIIGVGKQTVMGLGRVEVEDI
jgi:CRISPR/Cas system endoribonuclease Cas6 (RAMP superfamily)